MPPPLLFEGKYNICPDVDFYGDASRIIAGPLTHHSLIRKVLRTSPDNMDIYGSWVRQEPAAVEMHAAMLADVRP